MRSIATLSFSGLVDLIAVEQEKKKMQARPFHEAVSLA
jgi:phosphatidate phosphatase PAH1